MALYDVREAFCEIGRRVWQKSMVAANDGNFSYRLDANTVLCTPTGISKGSLERQDLVLCDLDGKQLPPAYDLNTRKITSEIRLHLNVYKKRPDVRSVIHTHAPHATAWALSGRPMPKGVLEEVELTLGEVPLTDYSLTGTWEFAEKLDPWLANHDAFLLSNHGCVTFGKNPFAAWYRTEILDHACRIFLLAEQSGKKLPQLSESDLEKLHDKKKKMGIKDPREGLPYEQWSSEKIQRMPPPNEIKFDGPEFDGNFPEFEDIPVYD